MHPIEQQIQAEATKAQADLKRLQLDAKWGGKLFSVLYVAFPFETVF
jgi:DNA-binding protein YbaB